MFCLCLVGPEKESSKSRIHLHHRQSKDTFSSSFDLHFNFTVLSACISIRDRCNSDAYVNTYLLTCKHTYGHFTVTYYLLLLGVKTWFELIESSVSMSNLPAQAMPFASSVQSNPNGPRLQANWPIHRHQHHHLRVAAKPRRMYELFN